MTIKLGRTEHLAYDRIVYRPMGPSMKASFFANCLGAAACNADKDSWYCSRGIHILARLYSGAAYLS